MTKTEIEIDIRSLPLLGKLSDEQFERICHSMQRTELEDGQPLFQQGQPAARFFVVLEGQVKLYRLSQDGDEKVIEIIQPGQSFAEAVMFMSARAYPVNAQALGTTRLLSFDSQVFIGMLSESVETCFRLMADMSQRLHHHLQEIDSITLHNASFRLATYLLDSLATDQDGVHRIQLNSPKHVIASRLSIQPETFSRLLARLTREGVLSSSGTSLVVEDIERLREMVRLS